MRERERGERYIYIERERREGEKRYVPRLLILLPRDRERRGRREKELGRKRKKGRKTLLAMEKFPSQERDRMEKLTRDGKFPLRKKEEEGRRHKKKEEGQDEER